MTATAVLASGGLDSAALLAETASAGVAHPIYVEAGMVWESGEKASLKRFVGALDNPNVRPITYLSLQVAPLLAGHWSVTGQGIPDSDAPDEQMYIPGRNILLIGLAAVWCSTHDVNRVVIGSLGSNPFPDATPAFFTSFSEVLSSGLNHEIAVEAPFRGLHKEDLIRRYQHLPIDVTLTCADPDGEIHCGACNKCFERQTAFLEAGVDDKSRYATGTP